MALNARTEVLAGGVTARVQRDRGAAEPDAAGRSSPELGLASGRALVARGLDCPLRRRRLVHDVHRGRVSPRSASTVTASASVSTSSARRPTVGSTARRSTSSCQPASGCQSLEDADGLLRRARVTASSCFSVGWSGAEEGGASIAAFGVPGGVVRLEPEDGVVFHTNHFVMDPASGSDQILPQWPDTAARLDELESRVAESAVLDVPTIQELLRSRGRPGRDLLSRCRESGLRRSPGVARVDRDAAGRSLARDQRGAAVREPLPGVPPARRGQHLTPHQLRADLAVVPGAPGRRAPES